MNWRTISVDGKRTTLDLLETSFVSGDPFTHLRFGDTDLHFMAHEGYHGNKRHEPAPGLAEELRHAFTIEDPRWQVACACGGRVFGARKTEELAQLAAAVSNRWHYHNPVALQIHYSLQPQRFIAFVMNSFHRAGQRPCVLVAGQGVQGSQLVKRVFNIGDIVLQGDLEAAQYFNLPGTEPEPDPTREPGIPDRNAYQDLDRIEAAVTPFAADGRTLIVALGQATRCLAGRLWHKGYRECQFFDVGSVIDALAGRRLRTWIIKDWRRTWLYADVFGARP